MCVHIASKHLHLYIDIYDVIPSQGRRILQSNWGQHRMPCVYCAADSVLFCWWGRIGDLSATISGAQKGVQRSEDSEGPTKGHWQKLPALKLQRSHLLQSADTQSQPLLGAETGESLQTYNLQPRKANLAEQAKPKFSSTKPRDLNLPNLPNLPNSCSLSFLTTFLVAMHNHWGTVLTLCEVKL